MKGYATKQPLPFCLLGLTLLAGCHSFAPTEEAKPPTNVAFMRQQRNYGPLPYSSSRSNRRAVIPAALTTAIPSARAPVKLALATSPPAVLPKNMPARTLAIPAAAGTTTVAACAYACNCPRPCCPPCCTLGTPCVPCAPCVSCPPQLCCRRPVVSLSFSQPAEPQKLPKLVNPSKRGDVLPTPETPPRRRSFVDTTAAPCFGHARDYTWVSGQVEYSRLRKEWRLRYASVDETDRFGGHVVLIENEHLSYLHDGQYVRLQGHLVSPNDPPGKQPYFRIEAFKVIDKPNAPPPTAN